MRNQSATLEDVRRVYNGPEGSLWELIMGEQVHIGGYASSKALADLAGIQSHMTGIDLCCCVGAGMRFLAKNYGCRMHGVDATEKVYRLAIDRARQENLSHMLQFHLADVLETDFENATFDFVWGEDAWCYVTDKARLIQEAARITKAGGVIAFTDWIEGAARLSTEEANRINMFMKFPYIESLEGYRVLLEENGCKILVADDLTKDFAAHVDLYIRMLTEQLLYDALRIIGDDLDLFQAMGAEMAFMAEMAHAGKMGRGRFIAVKA